MFRWLLRLLGWPRASSAFRYHDGRRGVFADPIAVYRRLWIECGCNPQELLAGSQSETEQLAVPKTEQLLASVRRSFALAPFDPETGLGCPDSRVYEVIDAFCDFLDEKKKTPAR